MKVVIAVRVVAELVFDLTKTSDFPEPMANLMAEDWRAVMGRGEEAAGQAVGRAAFVVGFQGILVPSKPDPAGMNVLLFPQRLTTKCTLEVMNAHLLEKLGRPT